MLRNGTKLPAFALTNQLGNTVRNDDVASSISVICFYRGLFCPTTDRYLAAYQDFYGRLRELGVELYFISTDSVEENLAVTDRLKIKYSLLSDTELEASTQFGTYQDKNKKKQYSEPALFISDIDGAIAYQVISSGPKGLPAPTDIAPMILYMKSHGGRY